jgi:hypothetical protein
MAAPDTYTVKVQGTVLQMTRGMDDPVVIGSIQTSSGLSSPVNEINIGSYEDTEIVTRPGRKKLGTYTYSMYFNPDDTVQQTLRELQGTDEEVIFELIQPEGTKTTRTFTAMVSQFGDSAKDDGVIMGDITLQVVSDAVRT